MSSAPQLLFANLAVASHLLSAFYAWRTDNLDYEEVYFDIVAARSVPVRRAIRKKNKKKRLAEAMNPIHPGLHAVNPRP